MKYSTILPGIILLTGIFLMVNLEIKPIQGQNTNITSDDEPSRIYKKSL